MARSIRTLCVTGHRPNRLGGYTKEASNQVYVTAVESLEFLKPESVITGMAQGWDQAIALACLELKIPYIAALPFTGQEAKWPKEARDLYYDLIKKAKFTEVVNPPPYTPLKMFQRNEWMVTRADTILGLWDHERKGGTFECIRYAVVCGKPIYNAWGLFKGQSDYPEILDKI